MNITDKMKFAVDYMNDPYIMTETGSWFLCEDSSETEKYAWGLLGEDLISYRDFGGRLDRLMDVILAYWSYRKAWEYEGCPVFEAERKNYLETMSKVDLGIRCVVRTICEEDIARLYRERYN